jgi:hypothetical protein
VGAEKGVATFSDLVLDRPGTYRLVATSGTLTGAETASITVSAGPATRLVIVQQPTIGLAGQVLAPDLRVEVRDAVGNLTDSAAAVTVAIVTGPPDATISGTTSVAAVDGVATFANVVLESAGFYTLGVTSGTLSPAETGSILVSLPSPTQLVFVQQPTGGIAGQPLTPGAVVEVRDAFGNLTASTALVTLTLGDRPGGAALAGTRAVEAVNGVATFVDLSVDKGGKYTLRASSDGLSGSESEPFEVTEAGSPPAPTGPAP